MKVVVTGGAGFIGSHLVDALIGRGDQVIVIDDLSSGQRTNLDPAADFRELDVRDAGARAVIEAERPDAVAHLAAQMSVSRSVREPLFDAGVNVSGFVNLLQGAAAVGARVVFASTGGALYGDAGVLPTPETYPAWPVSPYGVAKLAGEHYLHAFRAQTGLAYGALRLANVYGPRQNPHGEAGVVAIFCRGLLAGTDPVINGDGANTRDYVYVADVVRAMLLALDSDQVGHWNVGTGRQTSTTEIFHLVAESLGISAAEKHGPARVEQLTSALDASLIRQVLGWTPKMALEDGIAETAQWFRGHAKEV